nr:MAG TPA_asm: hypothetical protein [Bacteriophage sp.]DAT27281.1 MAG TPA: hypothetical protein [Caudoviricetes sp.]
MLSDFLSLSTVRILSIMLFYNPSALSGSNSYLPSLLTL